MHTGGPVKTAAHLTENNKKYLKTRADPIRLPHDWESYGIVEMVLISTVLPEGGAI